MTLVTLQKHYQENQCFIPDYSNFTLLKRIERNQGVLFTHRPSSIHEKNSTHVWFVSSHFTTLNKDSLIYSLTLFMYLFILISHFS